MRFHRSEQTIERLSLWQRWEHGLMGLSVLFLILSGTALAYHEHPWAHVIIAMLGGIAGRHWVHRVAAVGLVIAGVMHLVGLLLFERHRRDLWEVLPRLSDFSDAWKGTLYAIRGKGERPRYGWFTPMQKFQYWGVLLGCIAMGLSGALLWSPVLTLQYFPKWILDMMFVFHAKEAQLIFLVFIVWHLYDVHMASGNFPMNPAWLTGKMSKDVFMLQHPGAAETVRPKEGA